MLGNRAETVRAALISKIAFPQCTGAGLSPLSGSETVWRKEPPMNPLTRREALDLEGLDQLEVAAQFLDDLARQVASDEDRGDLS